MSNSMPCEKIVDEHQRGIDLSDQIDALVHQGTAESFALAVRTLQRYYDEELEAHLQHEEQKIMRPLIQAGPQFRALCIRIGQEHGALRNRILALGSNSTAADLASITSLLRAHTRFEDEELLPVLQDVFTPSDWADFLNFTPLPHNRIQKTESSDPP
jgi:hypothetical protein